MVEGVERGEFRTLPGLGGGRTWEGGTKVVLFGDAALTRQRWKPSTGKAKSCLLVYNEGERQVIY